MTVLPHGTEPILREGAESVRRRFKFRRTGELAPMREELPVADRPPEVCRFGVDGVRGRSPRQRGGGAPSHTVLCRSRPGTGAHRFPVGVTDIRCI